MRTSELERQRALLAPGWRSYDAATLEAQYRLTHHPDRERYYREYAQSSLAARQSFKWRDVRYGVHPRERLELFIGRPGMPLFVFIHGGYWRGLDAEMFSCMGAEYVKRGMHFANIEYPLAPERSMTDIARSVHAAVVSALSEARLEGADTSRYVLAGHSAGGHLAALLPSLHRLWPDMTALTPSATVPVSGLFDLEPLRSIGLNETLHMDAAEAERLSPAVQVSSTLPSCIVGVGSDETDEFKRQTMDYAAQLVTAGVPAQALLVPGANHFTVLLSLARPGSMLFEAAMAVMG